MQFALTPLLMTNWKRRDHDGFVGREARLQACDGRIGNECAVDHAWRGRDGFVIDSDAEGGGVADIRVVNVAPLDITIEPVPVCAVVVSAAVSLMVRPAPPNFAPPSNRAAPLALLTPQVCVC